MRSFIIVGAGFAGLISAIKLKIYFPENEVIVIDKHQKTANTFMSGMRLRKFCPGKYKAPPSDEKAIEDLRHLLKYIDDERKIELFSRYIVEEINFWEKDIYKELKNVEKLETRYFPYWFGPQWAGGEGRRVLEWLENIARGLGIERLKGELIDLSISDKKVEFLKIFDGTRFYLIRGDFFVLATGSSTGFLTASTNLKTNGSQVIVYYKKKLPLVGSTVYMIHPFGRALKDGTPIPGCWATDELVNVEVWLGSKFRDKNTEKLLKLHKLHDEFRSTVERFLSCSKGIILLKFFDKLVYSRVSIHYYQLGLKTIDGVKVEGFDNLYAVGDAEGWLLTNFKPRIPGLGLSKALVDARILVESFKDVRVSGSRVSVLDVETEDLDKQFDFEELEKARKLFTHYFLKCFLGKIKKEEILRWREDLEQIKLPYDLKRLYFSIIEAHNRRFFQGLQEPINISKIMI